VDDEVEAPIDALEAIDEPEEEGNLGDASTLGMNTRIASCQN
jgi:hypothetical protein